MPNPGAQLEFTEFLDEVIAWQTRDDLNQFFQDIRVPVANLEDYGSMKQGVTVTYNPSFNFALNDSINIIVDGVSAGTAPTQATFQELKDDYALLKLKFYQLLVSLKDAGVIASE